MSPAADTAAATAADTAAIAERARRVVRATGLTQREVAERLGIDATALSKALRGTRRLRAEELVALAELGDVPLRYLERGAAKAPASLRAAEAAGVRRRAEHADPVVRRSQILEATANLIATRGFHQVRVVDIARACGTSTGTVHYHFASLEDALRGALFFYADRLHRQLEARFVDADSPLEKLRRLIELQLPRSGDDFAEWSVWVQSWNEAMLQPQLRANQRLLYSRWRDVVVVLLEECRHEGIAPKVDVEALATRFTALVDGLAIQLLAHTTGMTVDRMRELLLDAFLPDISLR
ncbi:TetR family transcriptional regulator C-terminal domain-containing protein [Nocardioides maradonensis]